MKIILVLSILLVTTKTFCEEVDELEKYILEEINKYNDYQEPIDNSIYMENKNESLIHNTGLFDFIIVGGGSSGNILASRLAEIKKWKVLLLESGKESTEFSKIPGLYQYLSKSNKNWGYKTTPQDNFCKGYKNNQCPYLISKSLGGSSAVFNPYNIRGSPRDYNEWAKKVLDKDWSYENLLPYFKKAEDSLINNEYHGHKGPINNQFPLPETQYTKIFFDANENLHLKKIDYNANSSIGVSKIQLNIKNGKRSTTENYLCNTSVTSNVIIKTNAFVTKLLIDENTSFGVQFNQNGKVFHAFVKKDIILAAGAINTARLLLVSGIGPSDELKKHDVRLFKDLPVGINFSDSLFYPGIFLRSKNKVSIVSLNDSIKEFLGGKGILSKPLGVEAISFFENLNTRIISPNAAYLFAPQNGFVLPNSIQILTNFTNTMSNNLFNQFDPTTDMGIYVNIFNVFINGRVSLKSKNLFDFPNIDLGSYDDKKDNLNQAFSKVLSLIYNIEIKNSTKKYLGSVKICEDKYNFLSADYWYCSVKYLGIPGGNPTGTTKMGSDISSSVVDSKLKVHGISRLRIADPGIIPVGISGEISTVSFMIGEKAADLIKKEYKIV